MDPYNNLTDFIKLVYPTKKISAYYWKLIMDFDEMKKKRFKVENGCDFFQPFELAPLPEAVPCVQTQAYEDLEKYICPKQEGKTPMRNYNDAYASANITSPRSDTAVQRDYLLGRLNQAEYPKQHSFMKLFNLHVDNAPKTYKELVDAIKNDKFSLDAKIVKKVDNFSDEDNPEGYNPYGPFFGIVWDGPKPDPEGYAVASKDLTKQFTAAKDTIMTSDATTGLKALQDFEAWLPEVGTKAS